MSEFLAAYGLWLALVGVFVAMHWFGMSCCGRGRRDDPGVGDVGAEGTEKKRSRS
mgnify:CR=1 FL=1